MELKTKDLVFFLQSRKINISGIVEKEELCNLIINHINSSSYYDTNFDNNPSSSSANADFDNYTQSFDQIKQTCQNIFSSLTDKIASDFQKTTCFNQNTTQNQHKDNVTTQQPRSRSRYNNVEQTPGTSYTTTTAAPNTAPPQKTSLYETQSDTKPILQKSNPNCDCSDEEMDEICEKSQSIINGNNTNDNYHKMKKTKLSNSSSNNSSSFEEVLATTVGGKQQSDDDWQFIESQNSNDKPLNSDILNQGESSSSFQRKKDTTSQIINESELIKSCALDSNIPLDNNIRRRCSDSSLLNIKKTNSMNIDISSFNANKNEFRKIKVSCNKCGKSKSKIKNEILKLGEQLKTSNKSEDEINAKIKEFMDYLESKNQLSEMTETDSSETSSHAMKNDAERNASVSNEEICENIFDENDGINVYASNIESEITSQQQQPSCSSIEKTKRFISLGDISSSADLELMTVKQLKEILMLNRVDYKGCCEKNELKERVQRLWESHVSAPPSDKLASIDLCKICMDAPIECVFLECGHSLGCISCCKVLNECPICRSYIVRVVRIFKS
ncbi:hypothetical protein PVAND_006614 [Polypedilum vanderplanki]|uniref:RING-type domain-containing protein n=1 Tax=Polypedilum vanderplanki TaxID=319348 RepID=A0A9J6C5F2_POLVA|nr:hypothetical protein PVAND_006614 [Polypedilum vanderplanki]